MFGYNLAAPEFLLVEPIEFLLVTSYIYVKNVNVTSNQLNSNDMNKNNNGLFEVSPADIASMVDNYILYSYNIMD